MESVAQMEVFCQERDMMGRGFVKVGRRSQ